MRTFLAFFSLLMIPCFTLAQEDAATQAAQAALQAAQQSQQAAEQAIRDVQEANRQASEAAQQAMMNSQTTPTGPCCVALTATPKFSVKAGKYSKPTIVRITDSTREAVIYYTTDGWTPTVNSPRYRGPVLIDSTTTLQAIAISPYSIRSFVTSATYTINGAPPASSGSQTAASSSRILALSDKNLPAIGAPVHFVFAADVTSRTASVGDKIPLTLVEDLQFGNTLVKAGTPATVTIVAVDSTGFGGAPGRLAFEVDPLQSDAGQIPLRGAATREGQAKPPNAAFLVPGVGEYMILRHGSDAVIAKGTPFTASLDTGVNTARAQ